MRVQIKEKYVDAIENLGWTVRTYADNGAVELETYSPGGEDFVISIEAENFLKELLDYTENFDIDRHVEDWVIAKQAGVSGVPSPKELVEDAIKIKGMLENLARTLIQVEYSN